MDKLQPQTVYVPVAIKERPPEGERLVMALNVNGGCGMIKPRLLEGQSYITHWLEKQEGVYPLTGKELAALLKQTWQEAINWADKDNGVDMTDAEEDGPIMNFSDFLKSKGVEI